MTKINPQIALMIILIGLLFMLPTTAQQTVRPTAPIGQPLVNFTSTNGNIAATAATVTFTAPSSNVTISNTSTTAKLHVNFGGTATTGNGFVPPGNSYTYTGLPAVANVSLIGSAADGQYSVFAH